MKVRTTIMSAVLAAILTAGTVIPASAEDLESFDGSLGSTSLDQTEAAAAATLGAAAKSVEIGARIVYEWRDASKTKILLRLGTYDKIKKTGFGWVKILKKHRIYSLGTIVFVTKAPGGGVRQGNGNYRYTAYANKKVCTKQSCYYTDSVPVIAIVSRSAPASKHGVRLDGGQVGVITTYCANANRADACPSWVDSAFAASFTKSSSSHMRAADESTVELSYTPATVTRSTR